MIIEQVKKTSQLLNTIPFFEVLDAEEKEQIHNILKQRTIEKDTVIFSESQSATSMFIIEEGHVSLTYPGSHTIFMHDGDIFGEVAVINETARLGTAIASSKTTLLELNTSALYNENITPSNIALKITKMIAKKHSVLSLTRKDVCTRDVMKRNISDVVAFETALRYNFKEGKLDIDISHNTLKTVAAFLNTSGGTLFIGVNDGGEIIGLDKDGFSSHDELLFYFKDLLKKDIGQHILEYVNYDIINLEGKTILGVDVVKSNTPVFVKYQNKECFFMRSGSSTLSLKLSEFYKYYQKQF